MNLKTLKIYIVLFIICSCNPKNLTNKKLEWKEEIRKTEAEFAALLKEKGLHDAFLFYADNEAVLMRNNKLIRGKSNIDKHYKNLNTKSLSWSPDFIDVSDSGDLGYTYGKYSFTYKDSLGKEQVDKGIFHTIWKRQENGKWKFVWD